LTSRRRRSSCFECKVYPSKCEFAEVKASEEDEKAALGGVTKRGFEVVQGRDRVL
jgi:hypothetical protein